MKTKPSSAESPKRQVSPCWLHCWIARVFLDGAVQKHSSSENKHFRFYIKKRWHFHLVKAEGDRILSKGKLQRQVRGAWRYIFILCLLLWNNSSTSKKYLKALLLFCNRFLCMSQRLSRTWRINVNSAAYTLLFVWFFERVSQRETALCACPAQVNNVMHSFVKLFTLQW